MYVCVEDGTQNKLWTNKTKKKKERCLVGNFNSLGLFDWLIWIVQRIDILFQTTTDGIDLRSSVVMSQRNPTDDLVCNELHEQRRTAMTRSSDNRNRTFGQKLNTRVGIKIWMLDSEGEERQTGFSIGAGASV